MEYSAGVVALLAVMGSLTAAQPAFDGKIRKTADGRYEAYMVPPAAANHASFLELLPHGDLVLAWFSGTAEGADNCSIVMAYLHSGSEQWSNASLVSRRPGYSNQNPVLFLDPTGQVLYLFHSQQPATSHSPTSHTHHTLSSPPHPSPPSHQCRG
jgi:predicted neuraminidase